MNLDGNAAVEIAFWRRTRNSELSSILNEDTRVSYFYNAACTQGLTMYAFVCGRYYDEEGRKQAGAGG